MDPRPVNVLSLATGVGGLDLGIGLAIPAARLVCAVEIEAYACEVLASRMEEGRLDPAPVWTDLRTFDGKPWRGVVDILAAGYPCQPFSHAGKRRGADDPRHLWPHVMRIVCECQPGLVFIENVAGHLTLGFDEVREDLQRLGYRVEAGLFAAVEAGAPHRRARLFALAHHHVHGLQGERGGGLLNRLRASQRCDPDRCRCQTPALGDAERRDAQLRREPFYLLRAAAAAEGEGDERERLRSAGGDPGTTLGHHHHSGLEGRQLRGGGCEGERTPREASRLLDGGREDAPHEFPPLPEDREGWERYLQRWPGLEPALHRGADGMADRVDRLRLTGNGVVPQQAALAFRTLLKKLA